MVGAELCMISAPLFNLTLISMKFKEDEEELDASSITQSDIEKDKKEAIKDKKVADEEKDQSKFSKSQSNVKDDIVSLNPEELRAKSVKTPIQLEALLKRFGNKLLIHGMPGAGKSTFLEKLKTRPNTFAFDTDDLVESLNPKFKLSKVPEDIKPMIIALQAAYYKSSLQEIINDPRYKDQDIIILTNFWDAHGFPDDLLTSKGKIPISIVQPDPEEAIKVINKRYDDSSKTEKERTITLKMYTSWISSILSKGPEQIANFAFLQPGEYLSDVITFN